VSDLTDVQGLWALPAGADLELHGLALVEASVALALDVGVVDEDVLFTFYGEKPVAFSLLKNFTVPFGIIDIAFV